MYSDNYDWLCLQFQLDKRLPPADPDSFLDILRFLLNNNYISYQNRRYYQQKKGSTMGLCISNFICNSYIYISTKFVIQNHPSWLIAFQRNQSNLIFLACFNPNHGANLISNLLLSISREPHIRYMQTECEETSATDAVHYGSECHNNCVTVEKPVALRCNFLDVTLSFDPSTSTFKSEHRINYCTTSNIIHRTSAHPLSVFKCIALSQFHRLKRLSSSSLTFNEASKNMTDQLVLRGYSEEECAFAKNSVDHMHSLSAFSVSEVT